MDKKDVEIESLKGDVKLNAQEMTYIDFNVKAM